MKTAEEIKKEIIEIIDEFSDDTGTFLPYDKWQSVSENIRLYIESHVVKSQGDSFWFDIFNEKYPDEVSEILDKLEDETKFNPKQ
ncbi:hypothetical protein LCGC14_3094510 [marine sediment metagenome]|uniref:Uncharacterized protein n=1 Tax=marine sediment metagenome TaxID=412755 RepID=A0A0F8WYF2_9ZZZZ